MTFPDIMVAELIDNSGVYPDPEMERDVYEAPPMLNPDQDIFELLKTMQSGQSPFVQSSQPATPPVPETPFSKFIRSKVPVVLLAIIVYMLFALNMEFIVGGSVFSSLIVWELLEFFVSTFLIKQATQSSGLINLLFAFSGVSQEKAQLILRLLSIAHKLLRDIAIFMFTFVMIHLGWSYLVVGESLSEILDKDFSNLLKSEL